MKRTLEIIDYFQPTFYMIENPQTGKLKEQEFMLELPYKDVGYCKYGMSYRKRTRLWSNLEWTPRPLCHRDCGSMTEDGRRHREQAQRLPSGKRETWSEDYRRIPREELYIIPATLVHEIFTTLSGTQAPYTSRSSSHMS